MTTAFEMALRQKATDSFVLFGILVQPLIVALLGLWMLRDRGGDYGIFVVVGSGMTALWDALLFESSNNIAEERWFGTLELLVGQPTSLSIIVFGKNLANVLQSLLSMVASYLLVSLLLNYPLHVVQPVWFLLSFIFMIVSFVSFGLILAPLFILNPAVARFQNALEYPIFILCGFLFPIALLPGWTTPLSYLLAPYWAARALHLTASGGASQIEIVLCWGMMMFLSVIYLFFAGQLFYRFLRRAQVDGTLGMQ
jgi:ABC-2 type transport system permease protein